MKLLETINELATGDWHFYLQARNADFLQLNAKSNNVSESLVSDLVSFKNGNFNVVKNHQLKCSVSCRGSVCSMESKQLVCLTVNLAKHPMFSCVFAFDGELQADLLDALDKQKSKLNTLAYFLIHEFNLGKSLLLNARLLNGKAISVLERLSHGRSRGEVALDLYISERGVDYYIDATKSIFQTETIPATIYKASLLGLLGRSP